MSIYSQTGTEQQAIKLQSSNGVSADLRGPWYHGTNGYTRTFVNSLNVWLTRSETGGIPHFKEILVVYVIKPLDIVSFDFPGAGDNAKINPELCKNDKHWLKVSKKEVQKLMVITCDEQQKGAREKYSIFDFSKIYNKSVKGEF